MSSFSELVLQAKSILVLLPLHPSYDQVAAGVSLYLSLSEFENKNVSISCPTPILSNDFDDLVGVSKITQDLEGKNLVISLKSYNPADVEKVSYDIENSQFKLTIVPRTKVPPPLKDQVELSYEGIFADCVILIGGESDASFPDLEKKDFVDKSVMHIGIKDILLTGGRQVISFAQPKSSISELVFLMMKDSNLKINPDIATNLLAGIENATNYLSIASLNGETFFVVGELMQKGGKRLHKNYQNFNAGTKTSNFDFNSLSTPSTPSTYLQAHLSKKGFYPQAVFADKLLTNFSQFDLTKTKEKEDDLQQEATPEDWLRPKIYKGKSDI
ncbi:MAG: hypothetical protein N2558_03175 [Patescibacteria group bacterium]|nr:hypothetical protein [Patescibacteria group bacterium]